MNEKRTDDTFEDHGNWTHSSDRRFVEYYAKQSLTEANWKRLQRIRTNVLGVAGMHDTSQRLVVADIGCGAGAQSQLWASEGHEVHGLDVNEDLIQIARQRAAEEGLQIEYEVGTATALDWKDESVDVCLAPELLEHVPDWRLCLDELTRVLRTGGVLFLSTTNRLCPVQQEFKLPLYSWYPRPLKRRMERLVISGYRPELANYATYPAVNWFTFYELRRELKNRGLVAYDRFDALDPASGGKAIRLARWCLTRIPPVRLLGHVMTPYTRLIAVKDHREPLVGTKT